MRYSNYLSHSRLSLRHLLILKWALVLLFTRVEGIALNYITQLPHNTAIVFDSAVSKDNRASVTKSVHPSIQLSQGADLINYGTVTSTATSSLNRYLSLYLLTSDIDIDIGPGTVIDTGTDTSTRLNKESLSRDNINANTNANTSGTGTGSDTSARKFGWENNLKSLKKENDEVVRVLDANTVKLKRNGLVSFAAVQTPSGYNDQNFRFPDCMTKSPSSKLRKLLPAGTKVLVRFVENEGGSRPRGALVEINSKERAGVLVNTELVREGFAKPVSRGRIKAEELLPGITKDLAQLQEEAREKGLGMFRQCDDVGYEVAADDQFEPLDVTTEIQWGDDGGKVILKPKAKISSDPPPNPGDKRGCFDFRTYEEALRYYEIFYPYYGDVARLDRDGDGIPCSGLPHTSDSAKYRLKKPIFSQ